MLDVVFVDWFAEVVWFVVALGLTVTLLCGIALNCALVFVVVFALGLVVWFAVELVVLPALFVVVCAKALALKAAARDTLIKVAEILVMQISSGKLKTSLH